MVGTIVGAHGIRGEVTLKSFTAVPEDIQYYGPLSSGDNSLCLKILSLRTSGKKLIVQLENVRDRSTAETLRGITLHVPRSRLPQPDSETWYRADLIGLAAITSQGLKMGTVMAVEDYGAGAILEIAPQDGGESFFLPFKRSFVPDIDIAGGNVVILPPDDISSAEEDFPGNTATCDLRYRKP